MQPINLLYLRTILLPLLVGFALIGILTGAAYYDAHHRTGNASQIVRQK